MSTKTAIKESINDIVDAELWEWMSKKCDSVSTLPSKLSVKPLAAVVSKNVNKEAQKNKILRKGAPVLTRARC